eukprot:10651278-Karenia_brevis.AAC.1
MDAPGKAAKRTLGASENAGTASKHALKDTKNESKATKRLMSERTCDPGDARTTLAGMATKRRVTSSSA